MAKVHYSTHAARDLIESADYIARDKSIAAYEWVDQIARVCELLAQNPEIGEIRTSPGHGPCRSFVSGNDVIFFRGVSDGIEVVRIVCGERDIDRI